MVSFRFRPDRSGHPPASPGTGVPPLSGWEKVGAGATAIGAAGVGLLGFYASFDAVEQRAALWGFTEPWVLPVAIDTAIPVFSAAYLFLIRMGMPLAWVRFVPWALTLITCALNVAAGTDLWSKVAHGAMSLLWVVASEIAAHIYAVRIGAATNRRMDTIRWARWVLAPWPTFRLWRRMKLWELRSYEEVLALEQDRMLYESRLRAKFGRAWRRRAPVEALMPLRLAQTGVPLSETAPAGLAAAGIETLPTAALPAPVPPVMPKEIEPAAPAPAPAVPAAVKSRAQISMPITPQRTAPAPAAKPKPVEALPAEPVETPPAEQTGELTEDEMYEIVKAAIEAREVERFETGDLTGSAIGRAMGHTEGNGRKVRRRCLTRYAAESGVPLDQAIRLEKLMPAQSG